MFAFWPVGTNQQMLLLTFPQADWHRALPSVSFPFSQELSRDAPGCLVEAFCKSSHLVKRVQTLLKQSAWPGHSGGLGIVLQVFLEDLCDPPRVWCVSCGSVHGELAYTELNAPVLH